MAVTSSTSIHRHPTLLTSSQQRHPRFISFLPITLRCQTTNRNKLSKASSITRTARISRSTMPRRLPRTERWTSVSETVLQDLEPTLFPFSLRKSSLSHEQHRPRMVLRCHSPEASVVGVQISVVVRGREDRRDTRWQRHHPTETMAKRSDASRPSQSRTAHVVQ